MYTSNVCRVSSEKIAKIISALGGSINTGVTAIPEGILDPRQVRVSKGAALDHINARLKYHRGTWIPVISTDVAKELVANGNATWEPQYLLVYSMEHYLVDPDVMADKEEYHRAFTASQAGETHAIVAVVGNSRSTLSVCRNIVSGCQKMDSLKADAEGAMEASNVFLIE